MIPLMREIIKVDDLKNHIQKLIDCFCSLLNNVDVSLFANPQTLYAKNQ